MLLADLLAFSRIAIILVFATAFAGKIRDIKNFQETVIDFRLLSVRWSKGMAWIVLATELVTGLCLTTGGRILLLGFLLAVSLLLVFSGALVVVLWRRANISCNCFGWTDRRISLYDVARNTLFSLCSLLGIWASITGSSALSPSGGEIILIGLIATCFVVLVTNLADVVETLRKPFQTI